MYSASHRSLLTLSRFFFCRDVAQENDTDFPCDGFSEFYSSGEERIHNDEIGFCKLLCAFFGACFQEMLCGCYEKRRSAPLPKPLRKHREVVKPRKRDKRATRRRKSPNSGGFPRAQHQKYYASIRSKVSPFTENAVQTKTKTAAFDGLGML